MVVAEYLRKLPEDKIQRMHKDATFREAVFRNVLLSISDSDDESAYLRVATIDDLFDKYVRIEGDVTRISNYKLGPSDHKIIPLTADELIIYIQTSGPSWEKKYQILENDQVRFMKNVSVSMH